MASRKLLFTPGPVHMHTETLRIGGEQTPYFRNSAFSDVVLQSEEKLLDAVGAPPGSRALFLTASGTAAMEATVMNLLSTNDRAIVIKGGGFGERFCEICAVHQIPYIPVPVGVTEELQLPLERARALIVNGHETTTGRKYDLDFTGAHCRHHDMLHIVDAISLFVTDELDMRRQKIDALILSSHKGLALQPGLCMVVLAPAALAALIPNVRSIYFNFKSYLADGARGQTPFTPAVNVMLALNERLNRISKEGISAYIDKAKNCAEYFRAGILDLPLALYADPVPNAMTALVRTDGGDARELVYFLERKHNIVVTPNGGNTAAYVFRVSHMGEQTYEEIDMLLNALHDFFKDRA